MMIQKTSNGLEEGMSLSIKILLSINVYHNIVVNKKTMTRKKNIKIMTIQKTSNGLEGGMSLSITIKTDLARVSN